MKLCVIGLGYIGLPTAIMFAKHNIDVHGVDIDLSVVNKLSSGRIHIEEPGLQEMLNEVSSTKKLSFGVLPKQADAFIISVPTPINPDKSANLTFVKEAIKSIIPYIKKGDLIVLESTVPPRTIEDIVVPILKLSNLDVHSELFVAHSPERVLPGNLLEELVKNDRIVGGINHESSQKTAELYKTFLKGNIHLTNATTAEMVKLMENTYRDVNIAFANELAMIAENIGFDVWEAIELANCHPRVNIHRPGPGVGGHCIAVDPWFIYESAPSIAKLVQLSRNINDSMPRFVVEKVNKLIAEKKKIAVLGLAFKGNIDDMRESPSIEVINLLKQDYELSIYDPHVKQDCRGKVNLLEEALQDAAAILFLTDHAEFSNIDPFRVKTYMEGNIIIDTRNIVDSGKWTEEGFAVYSLGRDNHACIEEIAGINL